LTYVFPGVKARNLRKNRSLDKSLRTDPEKRFRWEGFAIQLEDRGSPGTLVLGGVTYEAGSRRAVTGRGREREKESKPKPSKLEGESD